VSHVSAICDHAYLGPSLWFYQLGVIFQHNHATRGKNPELRSVFYRFVRLLGAPFAVVLVFDGPGRPHQKRGSTVPTAPHWLEADVRALAKVFGFYCHTVSATGSTVLSDQPTDGYFRLLERLRRSWHDSIHRE
jgi:hypothetical protein